MTTFGVQDLFVDYGGRLAVSGISLTLPPGSITALVGGDGAGKTSILRALVGAVRPVRGTVNRPSSRDIGYMSAGPGLYRDLTVEENLNFSGRAYGVGPEDLRGRVEALIDRTGLQDARSRFAGKLSGGMRQKLALAMALVHEPKLLVLDEPTTGVDPVSRAEVWRLIARAAAGGAAVAIATSYIDEAERAESVVVLVDGVSLVTGSPDDIVSSIPGSLFVLDRRPQAWRRGSSWRVWSPSEVRLPETIVPNPDLEDAVVIAELMRAQTESREKEGVSP
jgi:ABC-2 type transport system ATP-binding protein